MANVTYNHDGANIIIIGTGIANAIPIITITFLPNLSDNNPAIPFAIAFANPKDKTIVVIVKLPFSPQTGSAIKGNNVLSNPKTPPKENKQPIKTNTCFQFALNPKFPLINVTCSS